MKDYNTSQNVQQVAYATAVPTNSYHDNNSSAPPLPAETFNEGGAREFLEEQAWPKGLQDTFVKNLTNIAFRYFICDDSGSMAATDGSIILGAPKDKKRRYFFTRIVCVFKIYFDFMKYREMLSMGRTGQHFKVPLFLVSCDQCAI